MKELVRPIVAWLEKSQKMIVDFETLEVDSLVELNFEEYQEPKEVEIQWCCSGFHQVSLSVVDCQNRVVRDYSMIFVADFEVHTS